MACSTAAASGRSGGRKYLIAHNIPWPRLESDRLDLSDDAFRGMARIHPKGAPMRGLRSALSELRLHDLAGGRDGRDRTILSAFRARTGRNQPSNTRFIFGPSVWLRGLTLLWSDFSRARDSQITFSVTHGWSAFGGADHGSQNVGLERRAWPLAQAVSGSVG